MLVNNFGYERQLALIENHYLISLFQYFAKIDSPLAQSTHSQSAKRQELLMQIVEDSPKNRTLLSSLRRNIYQTFSTFLYQIRPSLQTVVEGQIEINNTHLYKIEQLSDEDYKELDKDLQENLEKQSVLLMNLNLKILFSQMIIDFYNAKKNIEQTLNNNSFTEQELIEHFNFYAEQQLELYSPLIQVLAVLGEDNTDKLATLNSSQLPSRSQTPPFPENEEEHIWTEQEIYFDIAKLEKFQLIKLRELFGSFFESNTFNDFMNLSKPLEVSEDESDNIAIDVIQNIRNKMKALFQDIASQIHAHFAPLITMRIKQISNAASNLEEAKDNLKKMHRNCELSYPQDSHFQPVEDLQIDLKNMKYSLPSSLVNGLQFVNQCIALEHWIKLKITAGTSVNTKLNEYENDLKKCICSLVFLLNNLQVETPNNIDRLCDQANDLYMDTHPIKRISISPVNTEEKNEEELEEISRTKRKRDFTELPGSAEDTSLKLAKKLLLWADQEAIKSEKIHSASENITALHS